MIREVITYLSTPCLPYAKKMGYLYETIAMRERYRRNKASWQPHLENTRRFILSAAENSAKNNRITILGSGLLLDVPLKELSGLFKEIILADIIHLPETRKTAKKFKNVRPIEFDASGISERIFMNISEGAMELPESEPHLPENEADLVVSLNLLSQLPVVPHAYALKKIAHLDKNGATEDEIIDWCRRIIESHVSWLKSLPCPICLISDHEFLLKDKNGIIREKGSTLYGVSLPEPDESWTWSIAPIGEERKGLSKELHVGAWIITKSST